MKGRGIELSLGATECCDSETSQQFDTSLDVGKHRQQTQTGRSLNHPDTTLTRTQKAQVEALGQ